MAPSANVIDQLLAQAAQKLFNVQAQNRFTQAPIRINPGIPSGQYSPLTGIIDVNTPYTDPFWKDNQRVMAHEGIHSLLGINPGGPLLTPESQLLNKKVLDMFQTYKGQAVQELPSYIGTGDFTATPQLRNSQAEKWMENFKETLDPKTKKTLDRIMDNYKKSEKGRIPDESTWIGASK